MRVLYGQKCDHADLLPAVPSVTTLNFSVTTISCTPAFRCLKNLPPPPELTATSRACLQGIQHPVSPPYVRAQHTQQFR